MDVFPELQRAETIDGIMETLFSHFDKIIKDLQDTKGIKYKQIVYQAIRKINQEYNRHLSLKDVAEELQVTSNYLSRVFKEETGRNFSDWLNGFRIDKAKELLKQGKLKTYEIAEMTGFSDYKYFHQIFKKHSGMSPRDFRNNISL